MYAIQPGGAGQYSTLLEEAVGLPDVDPAESMLLMPTSSSVNAPVWYQGGSAHPMAVPLWRMEIPPDANGLDQNVDSAMAFSADGTIAYLMSTASSGNLSPARPPECHCHRSDNSQRVDTAAVDQHRNEHQGQGTVDRFHRRGLPYLMKIAMRFPAPRFTRSGRCRTIPQ